jgi:hypothetical protein
MQKVFPVCILSIICGAFIQISAQSPHSVGIQLNPYKNPHHLLQFGDPNYPKMGFVAAARCSWETTFNVSAGPEIGYYQYKTTADKQQSLSIGMFVRYTTLQSYKVRPFLEANGYFEHYKRVWDKSVTASWAISDIATNEFRYFLSPGISFYVYSNKISLDLMAKFSPEATLIGHEKWLPSFRLHYHF